MITGYTMPRQEVVAVSADDETAAAATTAAAPGPQAWALDEDDTIAAGGRRPWGDAVRHAGVLILGGVLVATFALAVYVIAHHRTPRAAPPTQTSAPVTSAPQPTTTPAAAAPPTRTRSGDDTFFLSRVHADKLPNMVGDDDAIVIGHVVCNSFADGTRKTLVDASGVEQRVFGWTSEQSLNFVTDAVTAYCPQYAR